MNILKRIKYILKFLLNSFSLIDKLYKKIDTQLVLSGKILSFKNNQNEELIINNLHLSEFKVFSQWGDDGIIQFLVNYLDISNKTFIEFGVEDYKEANTRFLLINNNWKGLVMDSSEKNVNTILKDEIYWKYNLKAKSIFITKENINKTILEENFHNDVGLLHIDIDGNDYWIWKEISVITPIIVIVEYNSIFGYDKPWTIPYSPDFNRNKAHYSSLYVGTSLLSLCDLAEEKGYYFIGSNSSGNNAYFVRKDKISGLKQLQSREGYVESQFRESRGVNGDLSFLSSESRLEILKGMKIYNTRRNTLEEI